MNVRLYLQQSERLYGFDHLIRSSPEGLEGTAEVIIVNESTKRNNKGANYA
jgi:hypothetical protein